MESIRRREPSPNGMGFSASYDPVGKKRIGRDKSTWVVQSTTANRKVWKKMWRFTFLTSIPNRYHWLENLVAFYRIKRKPPGRRRKKKNKKKSMSFLEDVGGQTSVSCGQNPRGFSVRNVTTLRGLSWQALTTTMFRVFSTVMRKSPRQVAWRGVSSETSNVVKWEKEKLQMQLQHTKATRAGWEQRTGASSSYTKAIGAGSEERTGTSWTQSRDWQCVDSDWLMNRGRVNWSLVCFTDALRHQSEHSIPATRNAYSQSELPKLDFWWKLSEKSSPEKPDSKKWAAVPCHTSDISDVIAAGLPFYLNISEFEQRAWGESILVETILKSHHQRSQTVRHEQPYPATCLTYQILLQRVCLFVWNLSRECEESPEGIHH